MLWGCGGFLEEYSQNEMRPRTVTDLQMLMIGEVYPVSNFFTPYLDLLTDDVQSGFTNKTNNAPFIANLERGEAAFTWSVDMFDMMKEAGVNTYDTWVQYYKYIKGCNVVLDHIDTVQGSVEEKEKIRGEALAMRAFYYFQLVNLFAKPYNAEGIDPATEPGVPVILISTISDNDPYPMRRSLAEVYAQIESDLLTAMPLMDAHGRTQNTKYRASDLFVHTLLSRMYLYMEQWEKAAEHASIVLARKPALINLTAAGVPAAPTAYLGPGTPAAAANVYGPASPELIWGYSNNSAEFHYDYYFNMTILAGDIPPFRVSQSLKETYDYNLTSTSNRGDLRPSFWYVQYRVAGATYDLWKGNQKSAALEPIKGMRTSELYLNRAEANAEMFIASGDDALRTAALDDLNTLRTARYDTRTAAYTPVDIAAGDELLQFVRDERRRELPYEEHRWFDLRRYGMPEIKHTFQKDPNVAPQEYTLPAGGALYVLPLPSWVLERNPNL